MPVPDGVAGDSRPVLRSDQHEPAADRARRDYRAAPLTPPPDSRSPREESTDTVSSLMHEVEDVTLVSTPHRWLAWSFESEVVPELSAADIPNFTPGGNR